MPSSSRPRSAPKRAKRPAVRTPQWSTMTPLQRRKAVAKDVLFRLKAGQLEAQSMTYVYAHTGNAGDDLQTYLQKGKKCTVCAIGGAICAVAGFEDRIKLDSSQQAYSFNIHERIRKVLGLELAARVEQAFEGWNKEGERGFGDSAGNRFFCRYPDDNDRLRAIYTQIAKTGTFSFSK